MYPKEDVLAPCVVDCASARATEPCGSKAMVLSGAAFALSFVDVPMTPQMEFDFKRIASAITERTKVLFVCNPSSGRAMKEL